MHQRTASNDSGSAAREIVLAAEAVAGRRRNGASSRRDRSFHAKTEYEKWKQGKTSKVLKSAREALQRDAEPGADEEVTRTDLLTKNDDTDPFWVKAERVLKQIGEAMGVGGPDGITEQQGSTDDTTDDSWRWTQNSTPHGTPHGTPQQQHRQLGTPNQATPRQQGTPGARATPHDEASRALRDAISSALPPSWRKVPSASRPGEFSYQQSQPQQSLAAAAVACSRRHLARARIARVRSPNRCGLSALRLILRRCNARDTADGTRSNTVENRVSRGRV